MRIHNVIIQKKELNVLSDDNIDVDTQCSFMQVDTDDVERKNQTRMREKKTREKLMRFGVGTVD